LSPLKQTIDPLSNYSKNLQCLSVDTKILDIESPQITQKQSDSENLSKINLKIKRSPQKKFEINFSETEKKSNHFLNKCKMIHCKSTQKINQVLGILSKWTQELPSLQSDKDKIDNLNNLYRNEIQKFKKCFKIQPNFEEQQFMEKIGKDCLVCNTSNCVYDEDVLLYCDSCSVMVHQMCVNVNTFELESKQWFCAVCKYKREKESLEKILKIILEQFLKLKGKKVSKQVLSNLKLLTQFEDPICIMCGRSKGVFFGVEGVQEEFCHASCAFWIDELTILSKTKNVMFPNEEDLIKRMEKDEIQNKDIFINKIFKEIDEVLRKFFEKKKDFKKFENLDRNLNKILDIKHLKNSNSEVKYTVKSARKRKILDKKNYETDDEQKKECFCLFNSGYADYIKKRVLFILKSKLFRNFSCDNVNSIIKKLKNKKFLNKKENVINQLFTLLNTGKFRLLISKKLKTIQENSNLCNECFKPKEKSCTICCKSKGIMVKCHHKNCDQVLHVECARRINCELGFPLKNLSKEKTHTLFCEIHSKNPGERTLENFRKIKEKEIQNAENEIYRNWSQLLKKRNFEETDLNDENRNINTMNVKKNNSPINLKQLYLENKGISTFGIGFKKIRNIKNRLTDENSLFSKKSIIWNLKKNNFEKERMTNKSLIRNELINEDEEDSKLSFIQLTDTWNNSIDDQSNQKKLASTESYSIQKIDFSNF
jgi:hypothetical protein